MMRAGPKTSVPEDIKAFIRAYVNSGLAEASPSLDPMVMVSYRPYRPRRKVKYTEKDMAEAIKKRLKERSFPDTETVRLLIGKIDDAHAREKLIKLICEAPLGKYINQAVLAQLISKFSQADFNLVKIVFDIAIEAKMINRSMVLSYIKAAGKLKRFDEAKSEYKYCLAKGRIDDGLFAAFMVAAIRAKEFTKQKRAFAKAQTSGLMDIHVYQTVIEAFGIIENYTEAEAVFIMAAEAGFASCLSQIFLNLACKLGRYETAKTQLDALCGKAYAEINYKAFVSHLVLSGEIELADSLFNKEYPGFNPGRNLYDFHGYNFSETYLICRRIFSPDRVVQLIVGRGSHSIGKSVVRQAVKFFCRRHDIFLEVDAKNEGLFRATAPAGFKLNEMRFAYASPAEGYYELDEEPTKGGGAYSVSTVWHGKTSSKNALDEGYYFAY